MLSEMSHYPNAWFIGLANRSDRGGGTVLKVLFIKTSADPPRAAISSETMRGANTNRNTALVLARQGCDFLISLGVGDTEGCHDCDNSC
jgi:hypothetical protein